MYYDLPDEKNSVVLEGGNEMLGLSEDYTIIKEGFFFDCYFTRDASVDVPIPGSTDVVTYDLDAMVKRLFKAKIFLGTRTRWSFFLFSSNNCPLPYQRIGTESAAGK